MVGIPTAADKWLKLESLQIAILQFFITGKASDSFSSSSAMHWILNLESKIIDETVTEVVRLVNIDIQTLQ